MDDKKKYYIIGGVILFLLIVLSVVLLAGGGGKPARKEKVELTWWKPFETQDNVSELIQEFQNQNKNVTVNFVKKNIETYEQELLDALASGSGPDIYSIHNDWLPKQQDKLTPAPATVFNLRQFQEIFADVVAFDFVLEGEIYAVPLNLDVLALYYNKDILGSNGIAAPPQTWPEFVEAVQKITRQDQPGNFIRSGAALGTAGNVNRAVDILLLLMLQNGTEFYSPDYTFAKFDQQADLAEGNERFNPGATALEFYTQFASPAKKTYTWNTKSDFSVDAFTQGKAAMMISYYYMIPVIEGKAPNLNWGVSPVPQVAADVDKVNFANYWGEAVSKQSGDTLEAWDFLKFITSKESLGKYYEKHELVSSRRDILAAQAADPILGVFAEAALTAKSVYKPDANLFEGIFVKAIEDVVLRNFTPEEAIRNASQQINLTLRR